VTVFFRVHQGGTRPVVQVERRLFVIDEHGERVAAFQGSLSAARFQAERSTEERMRLSLDGMRPGQHVLVLRLEPRGGTAVERSVSFSIR
jgi:hypothetical protein